MRNEQHEAAKQKLTEVLKMGEKLNLWVVAKWPNDEGYYSTVISKEHHTFSLGANWSKPGSISGSLDRIKSNGLEVGPWEYRRHGEKSPEVNVTATRDTAAIVQALYKRLMQDPAVIAISNQMRERLAAYNESQNNLGAWISTAQAKGFTFHNLSGKETHQVHGYSPEKRAVTLYDNGRIVFEATCHLDQWENVQKALN